MTIYLYCLFGNEEQLMPYFLRHYAPQVDRLFMLDGGCTDGSKALIEACPNAEIQESPFAHGGYDELAFVDYLAEKCREARIKGVSSPADWVIAVDADEFLYDPRGLRFALDEYRRHGRRAVKALGYQMVADKFPDGDKQLTSLIRAGTYDPEYDKLAAFDPAVNVSWTFGRHNYRADCQVYQPGLKLLHYRYFGEQYFTERNARNYPRRTSGDIAANRGYHCAPEHTGKYSLGWWKHAASIAEDVVS